MLFDQRRCTRSLRYGLRQRCVDFVANRRGHIVERRTEKRGFGETRHAIIRWRTDHLTSAGADEGFSPAPKAGSDIGRAGQTAFPHGIMEIEAYARSDGPITLLDTKSDFDISRAVRLVGTRPLILSCCKVRWRPIPSRVMLRTSPELIAPGRVSSHCSTCWSPTR